MQVRQVEEAKSREYRGYFKMVTETRQDSSISNIDLHLISQFQV